MNCTKLVYFYSLFTFPNLAAVELELDLCAPHTLWTRTQPTLTHTHTYTYRHTNTNCFMRSSLLSISFKFSLFMQTNKTAHTRTQETKNQYTKYLHFKLYV